MDGFRDTLLRIASPWLDPLLEHLQTVQPVLATVPWKVVITVAAVLLVARYVLGVLRCWRIRLRMRSEAKAAAHEPFTVRPVLRGREREVVLMIRNLLERDLTIIPKLPVRHVLVQGEQAADVADPEHLLAIVVDRSFLPIAAIRHIGTGSGMPRRSQDEIEAAIESDRRRRQPLIDAGISLVDVPSEGTEDTVRKILERFSLARSEERR